MVAASSRVSQSLGRIAANSRVSLSLVASSRVSQSLGRRTFLDKVFTAIFSKTCLDYIFTACPAGPVMERVWSSPTV